MTAAEGLLTFIVYVKAASRELGLPPPKVAIVTLAQAREYGAHPLSAAFIDPNTPAPGRILVLGWWLHRPERELRCVARHEVAHIYLYQIHPKDQDEAAQMHQVLKPFLWRKWKQGLRCD